MLSFAPDLDPTTPGILVDCTNIVPTQKGYTASYVGTNSSYAALATAARNLVILRKLDNSTRMFAGTQTKIWEGAAGSWTDRSSGAYDIGTDTRWSFAQFGDKALAIAKTVALQYSSAGAFAAVATAPKATHMAVNAGFVMLADYDNGSSITDGWYCSGYLDETNWTTAVTTECTKGRIVDTPGPITGLSALGAGFVAFKQNSMYVGSYAGAPSVWNWTQVLGEVGIRNKDAAVTVGANLYFMGNDNFYVFDGSRPVPIANGLREWFFKTELNPAYVSNVIATYDRPNNFIWFFYPSRTSTTLDKALVFHVPTQRWGRVTIAVEAAATYLSDAITWDGLGTSYSTWNDLPTTISYDSPFWTWQQETMAVINSSHVLQTLAAIATTSSITTGTVGDPQQFSTASRVVPRFTTAPTSATLSHQYDNDYGDTWTAGPSATLTNGKFDLMWSARWHREVMNFVGGFEVVDYKILLQPDGSE